MSDSCVLISSPSSVLNLFLRYPGRVTPKNLSVTLLVESRKSYLICAIALSIYRVLDFFHFVG